MIGASGFRVHSAVLQVNSKVSPELIDLREEWLKNLTGGWQINQNAVLLNCTEGRSFLWPRKHVSAQSIHSPSGVRVLSVETSNRWCSLHAYCVSGTAPSIIHVSKSSDLHSKLKKEVFLPVFYRWEVWGSAVGFFVLVTRLPEIIQLATAMLY